MQKWSVNGMYRMALFSSREIHPDEELTYDYNFSLFNPHEGQTCHCGNEECRGVIGGKGRKSAAKTPTKAPKMKEKRAEEGKKEGRAVVEKIEETKVKTEELRSHFAPMKPMSGTQKTFCRTHSVLLLRNLEKIRRLRELYLTRGPATLAKIRGQGQRQAASEKRKAETQQQEQAALVNSYSEEIFKAGLAALTTMRSVTTRRLAIAQENPDVSKVVQIARTFQQILVCLGEIKTEDGSVAKTTFDSVPSKEDLPGYHLKISEPIDFGIIEKNLSSGSYHSVAHIDQDILLLFQNNLRFYGSLGTQGKLTMMLREKYTELCTAQKVSLTEVVGEEGVRCLTRPVIPKTDDEEDVICCPCNQFKDEGVMVQCDACQCWQHTDCVAVDHDPSKLDEFTCKRCSGEKPNLDIPLVPQPEFSSPGELYYVSMQRDDNLHVTLGMTVYVLRAFKEREGEKSLCQFSSCSSFLFSQAQKGMGCHRTKSSLDLAASLTRQSVRSKAPQSKPPRSSRASTQPIEQSTPLWSTPTTWTYSEWSAFGSTKQDISLPLASIIFVPTRPSMSPPAVSLTMKFSEFPSTKSCPSTQSGANVGSPTPSPFAAADPWRQGRRMFTFVSTGSTRLRAFSTRSPNPNTQLAQNPMHFTTLTCG